MVHGFHNSEGFPMHALRMACCLVFLALLYSDERMNGIGVATGNHELECIGFIIPSSGMILD